MDSVVPNSVAGLVLLIDELPLRREAYLSLLAPWASEMKLKTLGLGSQEVRMSDNPAALILLSVGSLSISDSTLQEQLAEMGRRTSPIVIISDREDASDVVAAMAHGVKGYIPSRLSSDLALKTLTFILGGGDFFPPAALRAAAKGNSSGRSC